jgi:flagella basal body P-ring formation protein FlgA
MAMNLTSSSLYRFALIPVLAALGNLCAADTPAEIRAAVERAARSHLVDLIATAGLSKPSVEIDVLAQETEKACLGTAHIDSIDTKSISRMRFSVTCDEPQWRSEFVVRAKVTADVVVAAQEIRAGSALAAEYVEVEQRTVMSLGDVTSSVAAVVGKSSRRALRRGQVVNPRLLIEPVVFPRGAQVNIVASNRGVQVTVAGEALEAGRRGEIVRVRNQANGNVIRARVVDRQTVEPVEVISPSPR